MLNKPFKDLFKIYFTKFSVNVESINSLTLYHHKTLSFYNQRYTFKQASISKEAD